MNLEKWIIERRKRTPDLAERLGIKRTHLWNVQAAAKMPSYDLAERIAAMMAEDGLTTAQGEPITGGMILDHQKARMATIFKYKGSSIWPHAPWAKKLEEGKP